MILSQKLQGKMPLQKLRFLYRVIERLRLRHNEKGADFRNGVITKAEWEAFTAEWEKRNLKVQYAINLIKENRGLFLVSKTEEAIQIKSDGKKATDLDIEIDIDNIEE